MKASKRVLFLLAAVTSLQLVGCSTKDISSNQGDKNVEVSKVSTNEDENTNNTTPLTLEEALDIIGNITNGEKDLAYQERTTIKGKDYHGVLEEPFDETFRYLVDVNTREVFTEAPIGSGKLEKINVRDRDVMTVLDSSLTKTVEPKLKTLKGFDESENLVSKNFKEILDKNGIKLNHETPDNSFAVHTSKYSKFTKEYEQKLFYVFNRDLHEGNSDLTVKTLKEYHADLKLDTNDPYIKTIHELYNFITGAKISYTDFTKSIQTAMDNGYDIAIFPKDFQDITVYVKQVDSTKRIELVYRRDFNNTLKQKFYRKKYDTVQNFIDNSNELTKQFETIGKKYQQKYETVFEGERNESSSNEVTCFYNYFGYDKNRTFSQKGSIQFFGDIYGKAPEIKLSDELFNEAVNAYKSTLGDELYEKIDKTEFTKEHLLNNFKSKQIRSLYAEDFYLEEVERDYELYLDNAHIEDYGGDNAGPHITISVPVEAEGIRSL